MKGSDFISDDSFLDDVNKQGEITIDGNERGKYKYRIDGKDYVDPDEKSQKLYENHKEMLFSNLKLPNGDTIKNDIKCYANNNGEEKILISINGQNYYLGSDYIGFSKQWITVGLKNRPSEIWNSLMESRCFAGHILWSKGFTSGWYLESGKWNYSEKFKPNFITINQAKGGRTGIFDRIDWTLRLLGAYYQHFNKKNVDVRKEYFFQHSDVVEILKYNNFSQDECNNKFSPQTSIERMFYAFENSRKWLQLFYCFESFINYFRLNDIVNENYEIIELIDWFPVLPEKYEEYMNNSVVLLKKEQTD